MARKKILLVDDAETILMIERMILNDYDLVMARNGQEAVAMAMTERPDLILLDVMMPAMDGFAACKQIREKAETKEIPIIMVTTRGEEQSIEAGYQRGCNDYVTKPINSLELISKVRNYLGQ